MKLICSYCRREMGDKEPLEDMRTSHTMCPECFDYFIDQYHGLSFDEYLDRYDLPVFIMDSEARVVAFNRIAAETLGLARKKTTGLLAGEAMECVYARLPGGCGKTIHCAACAIRRMIEETFETGQPIDRREAYLERDDGHHLIIISTRKIENGIQLIVEEME